MPPKKGETQQEKAIRYSQRAHQFHARAKLATVIEAMKNNPDALNVAERSLIDCALLPGLEQNAEPVGGDADSPRTLGTIVPSNTPQTRMAVSTPTSKRLPRSSSASTVKSEHTDMDEDDKPIGVWDENATRFGQIPIQLVCDALQAAEPAVFTTANLAVITRRGAKVQNMVTLGRYYEAMTGHDAGAQNYY